MSPLLIHQISRKQKPSPPKNTRRKLEENALLLKQPSQKLAARDGWAVLTPPPAPGPGSRSGSAPQTPPVLAQAGRPDFWSARQLSGPWEDPRSEPAPHRTQSPLRAEVQPRELAGTWGLSRLTWRVSLRLLRQHQRSPRSSQRTLRRRGPRAEGRPRGGPRAEAWCRGHERYQPGLQEETAGNASK